MLESEILMLVIVMQIQSWVLVAGMKSMSLEIKSQMLRIEIQ